MALGSTPLSWICGGHWVTRLTLSYEVNTGGIVPMPSREMGTTVLGKMQALCLVVAREECHWIMASTTGVMRHLGMEHPPFPQGIHYGDIDEYDDGIEDEEGEYESNNE
uniref:Uncharacterized protein n=1 Tax=Lactuca sativa TaxID=4236 RepID=A0A9R1WVY1_LACSA|nr:hypothetical protein LSAT_V11C800404730 [Lactuca sativa]